MLSRRALEHYIRLRNDKNLIFFYFYVLAKTSQTCINAYFNHGKGVLNLKEKEVIIIQIIIQKLWFSPQMALESSLKKDRISCPAK